jgi:amidophosphoribosyltransferase
MKQSVSDVNPRLTSFEASCFDGVYITGDITREYLDRIERERLLGPASVYDEDAPKNQMNLQFPVATD